MNQKIWCRLVAESGLGGSRRYCKSGLFFFLLLALLWLCAWRCVSRGGDLSSLASLQPCIISGTADDASEGGVVTSETISNSPPVRLHLKYLVELDLTRHDGGSLLQCQQRVGLANASPERLC